MAKKLFVFAIGGTGERVMRSLTMVLASGAPAFDTYDVYPIIVDYDDKNEDKLRTVKLLQNYAAVYDAAYKRHGDGNTNVFFAAKMQNLNGLTNYVFPFNPAAENETFRQHIGYDTLSDDKLATKDFLSTLYDESNRSDAELNLNMKEGFKGNPNIGSVVFNSIADTVEFRNFVSNFSLEAGDKVVIIGSLFGGTGASGIPEIVKAIHDLGNNAQIATIFVLPYFAPEEKKDGAIKASRFNSKTKAAISYYEDSETFSYIVKSYFVGDFYPTTVSYSEGGSGQKNNANLVELIAAMMIEDYVSERHAIGNVDECQYKYSIDADIVVNPKDDHGQRLFVADFDSVSNSKVLTHLEELAIALKFFHEEVKSGNTKDVDFTKYLEDADRKDNNQHLTKFYKELESFYHKYQGWLKELDFEGEDQKLPGNSHRFALCDMEKGYPDIILKRAKSDEDTHGGLGDTIKGFFSGTNKLTDDNLKAWMNKHIKDDGKESGHFDAKKSAIREGHDPEWVFFDVLHKVAVEGQEKLNK